MAFKPPQVAGRMRWLTHLDHSSWCVRAKSLGKQEHSGPAPATQLWISVSYCSFTHQSSLTHQIIKVPLKSYHRGATSIGFKLNQKTCLSTSVLWCQGSNPGQRPARPAPGLQATFPHFICYKGYFVCVTSGVRRGRRADSVLRDSKLLCFHSARDRTLDFWAS